MIFEITSTDLLNGIPNGILLVYSPFCVHCKNAMPVLDKLNSLYPNINIYKLLVHNMSSDDKVKLFPDLNGVPAYYQILNKKIFKPKFIFDRYDIKSYISLLNQ
jgi:thiol-disulfide isomerase/thioredoxin